MANDNKKRIEKLIYSANEQISQMVQSEDDVKELLDFRKKFYRYSLRNTTLIEKQFRGASAVGTFQFWKEQGFHVKRGEKGIEILVPVSVQSFKNANGEVKSIKYATKGEKEKIERGEIEIFPVTRFKIGHVFDVSQTNAKASDLPKLFPNRWIDGTIPNYDVFYQGLEKLADSIGVKIVEPRYELGVSKGASYTGLNEVTLNPRNGELQNIKTLLHELAHAKLHTLETRRNYTKAEREFQAELVAYAVCSNYGFDTSEYSLAYLKDWTKGTDIATKGELLSEVYDTCMDYIKVIDQHLMEEEHLIEKDSEIRSVSNHMKDLSEDKKELFNELVDKMSQVADEELEKNKPLISLKDCGILLRHVALESIMSDQEMYFCEIEDFEDLLEDGTLTKETWEEFERDLEKYKLVENGYLELHTDFENFEQDKENIDCVMTGYMEFWKQFEQDYLVNNKFPNQEFRKVIVEQILDRHDGTTDIFQSDLEVLKKIEVLNLEKHKLTNIAGIEYFESLRKLDVSSNPLINLEVSELLGLKELYAYGCQIHSLKLPKSETLEILDVTLNNLETLDLEKQSVLSSLSCSGNELSTLYLNECPCLESLICSNNFLSELDLENNEVLKILECENNDLKEVTLYSLDTISQFELNGNPNVNVTEVQAIDPTIKFLTEEQVHALIERYHNQSLIESDYGSFYSKEGDQWIGIDNMSGNVFVEPFNYKEYCMEWLNNNELPIPYESMDDLFPDENFRKAILQEVFEQDKSSKNTTLVYEQLSVIQAQEVLLISNYKIKDLTGIEQFTSLKHLDVSYNPIKTLKDVSSDCRKIYAHNTHLSKLEHEDIPKEITTLDVTFSRLNTLDVSDREELQFLFCSYNQLTELKFDGCDQLSMLMCQQNGLSELSVDKLPMLEQLECRNNLLSELVVPDTLVWLSCESNHLKELKLNHCEDLEHLECSNNQLDVLEVQALEKLTTIDCRGNERSPHELIHGVAIEVTNEQEKER